MSCISLKFGGDTQLPIFLKANTVFDEDVCVIVFEIMKDYGERAPREM